MQLARGQYIGFLNSDDIYTDNAFFLKKYIKNYPQKILFLVLLKNIGAFYMDTNLIKFIGVGAFTQVIQLVFIKLSAAKKVGLYNLKYKFSSDYDYFLG